MSTNNKYESMSVLTALKYAREGNLLLPDIQREYVWNYDAIESLFESIVDDYPIGSCIFWKTNRATINSEKPNLYRFISRFKKGETKNEKVPEVLSEENDYYIVLDGQQRITSLNIALYGEYTYYKGGKGHKYSSVKSWKESELYYDLEYYNKPVDEEHPIKRFCFLTKSEAESGRYYKVKLMLAYDTLASFLEFMILSDFDKRCREDLARLYEKLRDSSSNGLIHYYSINEKSYDKALNIFVRVNSTGQKLSKSDLLFSTLIDGWKEGKQNVENLLELINNKRFVFAFNKDYLMRLGLVLADVDPNLKITSLTKSTIASIRTNWERIEHTLDKMTDILCETGFSDETLTSYNATMPIAYYLYKGGNIDDDESKNEVRKFLFISMVKGLFGVAGNAVLAGTRNVLKGIKCNKEPFRVKLFSNLVVTSGRTFNVDEAEIDRWLDTYEKGVNAHVLLSLLVPDLRLDLVTFHQDHCHPYSAFEDKNIAYLGLSEEKVKDWQKKRNLLPNLQLLCGDENETKNKKSLKAWVAEGNDFAYHPLDVSLDLKDFDEFFEKRRELMKTELMEIFELIPRRQSDIKDYEEYFEEVSESESDIEDGEE